MMFSKDDFTISLRENENDILNFQKEKGVILPPSYLYVLFNFGEIKYNHKVKYYYSDEIYRNILLDKIPSINTLRLWMDNYWDNLMKENQNLDNKYLPILNTYAPNVMFLVGIQEFNLDKIFLYDDDYEGFNPIFIANDLFEFLKIKVK